MKYMTSTDLSRLVLYCRLKSMGIAVNYPKMDTVLAQQLVDDLNRGLPSEGYAPDYDRIQRLANLFGKGQEKDMMPRYIGNKYPNLALTDFTRLSDFLSSTRNTRKANIRYMSLSVENNVIVVGVSYGKKSVYNGRYSYIAFHFIGEVELSQPISLILDLRQRH